MTKFHKLSAAEARLVHVRPSGEVITRSPAPEEDTATNNSEPDGPPYMTERHSLSAAEVRLVHNKVKSDIAVADGETVAEEDVDREGSGLFEEVTVAEVVGVGELHTVSDVRVHVVDIMPLPGNEPHDEQEMHEVCPVTD